ncbi:hypothetical protein PV433_27155 [Paenibacillus sp. GYB004]|uniref:hypothetical protein n=1 Tax=Paenibacillus sp. GYB004 TaxID=2994393 RepID=UPI002F9674EE
MKIKIVKGFRPNSGTGYLNAGDVLEARRISGLVSWDYQCIEGEHSGVVIPFINCIELPVERTYTESEYSQQQYRISKLKSEIKELKYEKQLMLDTIEREAAGEQPEAVVLPRDLGEAIAWLRRSGFQDFFIVALSGQTPMLGRDYSKETIKNLKIISNYRQKNEILKALVNGYRIEEATINPDERLGDGIKKIVDRWGSAPSIGSAEADRASLSEQITEFVKDFYAAQ